MLSLGGCPPTGRGQPRGAPFSPSPIVLLPKNTPSLPILNMGLKYLLNTYCVLGFSESRVGFSSLFFPP